MSELPSPRLEDVFKTSGLPTFTFVQPVRYPDILLSLRTPGRCLVIEGPSGIGKTTAIENALNELGIGQAVTKLSARRQDDVEYIRILPETRDVGTVIVDDFHKLDLLTQKALADYLKVLADGEDKKSKIIILGINRAGDNLIRFAADLVNRIDIVRFESEPDEKIEEVINKGSQALRVNIPVKKDIIADVRGSFYLTQMLCREICLHFQILQAQEELRTIEVSYEAIRSHVWDRLALAFRKRCERFCSGTKIRKEGRAPYLHILNWLANGDNWTLVRREIDKE
jgi:Holliday junction resolvasome RuvABC ATP-dependent DNA helicase subunit